ncbi:antibiotic biosynthesis monooxygenase [Gordonia sp. CPCC 206044]|uniref:antibiotic biosynthesis monooxygenase family protein n=1 Tax=Gordonia sp. CPCC 206044 TaxID=3140793 RepID=UPI003AF363DE
MTTTHRIDKFSVPADSMDEFLERVHHTHALLGDQPGILRNEVMTLTDGPSEFNVVTTVTWESVDALADAGHVVAEDAARTDFDRAAFLTRLGVRGDFGTYR